MSVGLRGLGLLLMNGCELFGRVLNRGSIRMNRRGVVVVLGDVDNFVRLGHGLVGSEFFFGSLIVQKSSWSGIVWSSGGGEKKKERELEG